MLRCKTIHPANNYVEEIIYVENKRPNSFVFKFLTIIRFLSPELSCIVLVIRAKLPERFLLERASSRSFLAAARLKCVIYGLCIRITQPSTIVSFYLYFLYSIFRKERSAVECCRITIPP